MFGVFIYHCPVCTEEKKVGQSEVHVINLYVTKTHIKKKSPKNYFFKYFCTGYSSIMCLLCRFEYQDSTHIEIGHIHNSPNDDTENIYDEDVSELFNLYDFNF